MLEGFFVVSIDCLVKKRKKKCPNLTHWLVNIMYVLEERHSIISDLTRDWLLDWICAHLLALTGDSRTPSLSMAQLWILNKSMPSDWTPEPLVNENHCSESSILPPSPLLPLSVSRPLLCLHLSHCFYFPSLSILSPFALRPLEDARSRTHKHTHTHLTLAFCMFLVWSFFFFFFFLKIFLDSPMSDPVVAVHRGSACSIWRVSQQGKLCFWYKLRQYVFTLT